MKLFKFSSPLFYIGAVLFAASCGSGANEKAASDSAAAAAAADSAAKAKAASTIVTTPQNMVVVTHKVADYAKWLVAFESHDSAKLAAGLHNYVIARGLEDSNMVMVALKVDDTARAKAFEKDPSLKVAMKKGGVMGAPTMSLITEVWQDTARMDAAIRSRTSINVKDWNTFLKGYEDGKQDRMDNGIQDRVIGHDADDDKKVQIVQILTDTAKAFAYFKSDALKKRREAGGVIGEPVRFFYRIAKHY